MMTETEFLQRAEAAMKAIESAIDEVDADIECARSGAVLTLELPNDSKVIVNLQAPMQQIWVAARSGGFHFGLRDGVWIDSRDGGELFSALSRILSLQGGRAVVLRRL